MAELLTGGRLSTLGLAFIDRGRNQRRADGFVVLIRELACWLETPVSTINSGVNCREEKRRTSA
jgi:hypothetical protein